MLIYGSSKYVYEEKKKYYHVGDHVKIKSLEIVRKVKNRGYDFPAGFNNSMESYCGKVATVKRVGYCAWGEVYYLDIDNECWQWTAHMFAQGIGKIMENE
jgi:hypothetical protein